MTISTRGRYALRVLIDLAEHPTSHFIPLKEIAARQEISLKYIEKFMPFLVRAGMVVCASGKGGGYRIAKSPDSIRVGDVLRVVEEELAPVSCLVPGAKPCPRAPYCKTLGMWKGYYDLTTAYFDGIKLSDLVGVSHEPDYVI